MVESTMTYILVGKSEESQKEALANLLKTIFKKNLLISPDIHRIDSAGENSIGIEEVKDFQKEMKFRPFQESVQVGIIMEAEKLTPEAQNSLLKTLEESSSHSMYILCVNNEKNLLPTIISRGQTIYSQHSERGLWVDGMEPSSLGKEILDMDLIGQFNTIEKYSAEKESSMNFLNSLEEVFRQRLELDIKNGNIDSSKRSLEFLKMIQNSREKITANCNRRLTLEALIVQLNA